MVEVLGDSQVRVSKDGEFDFRNESRSHEVELNHGLCSTVGNVGGKVCCDSSGESLFVMNDGTLLMLTVILLPGCSPCRSLSRTATSPVPRGKHSCPLTSENRQNGVFASEKGS